MISEWKRRGRVDLRRGRRDYHKEPNKDRHLKYKVPCAVEGCDKEYTRYHDMMRHVVTAHREYCTELELQRYEDTKMKKRRAQRRRKEQARQQPLIQEAARRKPKQKK